MRKFIVLLTVLILASGCARDKTPGALSSSGAHQKLISLLKEENGLRVVTKEFPDTLWIYLPLEKSFLQMKAKEKTGARGPSADPTVSPKIHFLDGEFTGQDFRIRYDISPFKQYAKDYGYTSVFTEEYQEHQRNILTAVSRAYAGTEDAPDFFVLVMADTVNGLEARVFFYLEDLKRAYTDQTFYEEYAKRVISDQPFGDPGIIGDTGGRHVDFHNITLPEFLAKQMIFRINFKYTRSAFAPTGTPKEEILNVAAETVDAYGFQGFQAVTLEDLHEGTVDTVLKRDLAAYSVTPSEGRLIHIQFK